jgi:hypothetical protein
LHGEVLAINGSFPKVKVLLVRNVHRGSGVDVISSQEVSLRFRQVDFGLFPSVHLASSQSLGGARNGVVVNAIEMGSSCSCIPWTHLPT